MAARGEKKRNPNFSKEECALLAKLMGGITSETKKKMWAVVELEFNSHSNGIHRSLDLLMKKWDNLVQVHRPKYMDYRRQLQLTGHGNNTAVLSEITDAVMNVIGKVDCGIEDIGVAESFDATCIHESQNVTEIGETDTVPIYQMLNEYTTYQPLSECAEMAIAAPSTQSCIGTTPPSSHCSCHECGSIRRLKKRKLELEVAILAKRFEKEQ
ncbi:uncharacterized protein LOC128210907 [Mya arenaria]|uniref:uncharacterized protein LOC128210907 n=1 Tax=Mya arenaria TaxID=6604 RepID=UPI0022E5C791|nr:uncharacterized protein LOC128210907 [Mya arenaria]